MSERLKKIADSQGFQSFIVGVILLSAMLVGLESYPWIGEPYGPLLRHLESAILGILVVELAIRIGACGRRPWVFFQDRWNLFDFTIVALCFLPDAQFAAVLRMLRLARLVRMLRLVNQASQAEIYRLRHEELARAHLELLQEQERSERLLLNVLPLLVAERLKSGEELIADHHPDATVLFADIVGFTRFAESLPPVQVVGYLDQIFSRFDLLAERFGLEKIKTIGDAYMVVAGIPKPCENHAQAAAELALAMLGAMKEFNRQAEHPLQIRIGLHSGPVVAGVIGRRKFIYDLWGDTVNTASRMESHSLPDRIQITAATQARLPAGYAVEPRGEIEVKGKGRLATFFLLGGPEEGRENRVEAV
jgi:class 3 adenylate cyclase